MIKNGWGKSIVKLKINKQEYVKESLLLKIVFCANITDIFGNITKDKQYKTVEVKFSLDKKQTEDDWNLSWSYAKYSPDGIEYDYYGINEDKIKLKDKQCGQIHDIIIEDKDIDIVQIWDTREDKYFDGCYVKKRNKKLIKGNEYLGEIHKKIFYKAMKEWDELPKHENRKQRRASKNDKKN